VTTGIVVEEEVMISLNDEPWNSDHLHGAGDVWLVPS
jgi:hypothetical protein